jgi:hypothetical protein
MGTRTVLLLAILGLSGCSGPIETRILSAGQGVDGGISLVQTPPASPPLHAKAYDSPWRACKSMSDCQSGSRATN